LSGQKDVFEIIERMNRRIDEREQLEKKPDRPELQLQEVELEPPEANELGESFSCSSCGRFQFNQPTVCYWCQPKEEES